MLTYYGPRPDNLGGGNTIVAPQTPTSNANPMPVEHCFNLGDLKSYLMSRGLDDREADKEIQENYQMTTEPDGTTWYCGYGVSKYKPRWYAITRGKYAGGKVKVVKGKLQIDTSGNGYYVDVPTEITARDKDNKPLDWLEVRSELQPVINQPLPQQTTIDSLLRDKTLWIGVGVFALVLIYFLRK